MKKKKKGRRGMGREGKARRGNRRNVRMGIRGWGNGG